MKKEFEGMNTSNLQGVAQQIESATGKQGQQATADAAEQQERAAALRTQGRKGCKAVRINMAFTPDNHKFVKVYAKATGYTMTEITNLIIEKYRSEHPEIIDKATEMIDILKSW